MISFEYRQFLNEKVIEYLHNYVKIGDKLNFRCPVCGDSHKSATKRRGWWYMQSGSYYCFNCGTGMSGIKFLEFVSGNAYEDIKKEYTKLFLKSGLSNSLSSCFDVPKTEPTIFDVKALVKPEWKKPLSEEAKAYLDKRLVSKSPFFTDNFYSWTNKKGNEYILIDWILNGVDAYFQLNDFKKFGSMKYIFPKDTKKLIYGLDNIDVSYNKIFLVEGVYDSIFIPNCCALGTKAITDYQLKIIQDRFPHHELIVSFDCDKPGIEAMIKMIQENRPFKYFIWWNKDIISTTKDINEFIINKNDPMYFSNTSIIDSMIFSPLQAKLFLIKNNLWISNFQRVNNFKLKSLSPNLKRF